MITRAVGGTAVRVSSLGFGGASIGNLLGAVEDADARAAVDAAWDAGVRYFDTAPHYGLGLSERRLGAALDARPRGEYTISTKVGRLLVPNPEPTGSDLPGEGFAVPDTLTRSIDFSREAVHACLEASVTRLGLDRVDIALVHDPEDHLDQAVTETIPALSALRDEGVVGAVGAGMNYWQPLLRIVQETDVDVVMVAGRWSLLDRSAAPLLDACAQRDVAVVVAAPFNSGLTANPWPGEDASFDYRPVPLDLLDRARALARICRDFGATLPHAAIQFPLRHPAVVSVVAGMRTAEQSHAAARWASESLDSDLWAALDLVGSER